MGGLHPRCRRGQAHAYDFFAAARKIQLAEAGLKPSADCRRVELEPLTP
jgi:hypothetical protein